MGGAPPPRLAAANIPHFLPQRNPNCTFSPTRPSRRPRSWENACSAATSGGQPPSAPAAARTARRGCRTRRLRGPCTRRRGAVAPPASSASRRPRQPLRSPAMALSPLEQRPPRAPARCASPVALSLARRARCAARRGCGSSASSGSSVDPANAVPASAPLYAGAIVRPEGSLQSGARAGRADADPPGRPLPAPARRAADARLGRAGLQARRRAVAGAARGRVPQLAGAAQAPKKPPASCSRSCSRACWANPRRAAPSRSPRTPSKARSCSTRATRPRRARSCRRSRARAGAQTTAYRGVSYQATSSGIAFGVVARLVVIGTEPALHAVVDTTPGGPALARAAELRQAARRRPGRGAGARLRRPRRARRRRPPARRRRSSSVLSLLAGSARGERLAGPVARPRSRSTPTRRASAARRHIAAGCSRSSRAGRARRWANCRANRGWRSASATSAPRSARDAQALQGIASLGGLLTAARAAKRRRAGISVKRPARRASSRRCTRSARNRAQAQARAAPAGWARPGCSPPAPACSN